MRHASTRKAAPQKGCGGRCGEGTARVEGCATAWECVLAGRSIQGLLGDVVPDLTPLELYRVGCGVAALAGLTKGRSEGRDGEDATGGGHESPLVHGRAGVEDLHPVHRGRGVDPDDRPPGI